MEIIKVSAKSLNYEILIENGQIDKVGEISKSLAVGKKAAIVTDANVFPLYGDRVEKSLSNAGFVTHTAVIDAGEEYKRLFTIEKLYSFFLENELTRSDIIIALGGGVIGDMCGFAAGTYLRGVPYIGVPTTLLSQIDSSVGGKTGVDLPEGKNLVGVFNQPKGVIIDPIVLSTLSPQIFSDGMAEAIKYGCIKDKELFEDIFTKEIKGDTLLNMISACLKIKRDLVEKDELDKGDRMLLNFGHTVGHAIEKCGGYTKYSHGNAISAGMVIAARLGEKLGKTKTGTSQKIINILKKYNLLTETSEKKEDILNALLSDKKRMGEEINFILLKEIGQGFIQKIPVSDLKNIIEV